MTVQGPLRPAILSALLVLLCLAAPGNADAADEAQRPALFALIIGVNRSVESDLRPLLYADDDAVRYQELFRFLGAKTQLLARLDPETAALSPQAAAEAIPPTKMALDKVVALLSAEIALARQRGVKSALYVLYAGHGNVDGEQAYLTLEDGRLSAITLERDVLARIDADEEHLVVDACYSYLLVGARGPGGERRPLHGFSIGSSLGRRKHLGLLLSTSAGNESHEWGDFQAGIFSHEVRSGLYGAADLDGDGHITYAEMASFLHRANQAIANEKFRPQVFARAPAASTQLLDLRSGLGRSLAIGNDFPPAHYLIEDQRGVRFLDFHNSAGHGFRLVRPGGSSTLYLRRLDNGQELTVPPGEGALALSTEGFADPRVAKRGAAHQAFSLIFSLPFDETSDSLVALAAPPPAATTGHPSVSSRKILLWTSGAVAVAGLATGGLLWWDATRLSDQANGSSQRRTAELNDGIHARNIGTAVAFSIAGAAIVTGVLSWFLGSHQSPGSATTVEVGVDEIRFSRRF
jgi:hypothetical protein